MWWIPLLAAGFGMQAASQVQAGKAAKDLGKAKQQAANYQAQQLLISAGQEQASSQLAAMEEHRQARLLASRALALAAASGAGAADPTVVHIIADLKGEGAYRAAVRMYQGEEMARALTAKAQGVQYEGQVAYEGGKTESSASQIAALGTLLTGGGSLYEKYSGSGKYS